MDVFVAGATGVIGSRLVPLLVQAGHTVTGMSRSNERATALTHVGARGVVADVYDREALQKVLASVRPEVVVDQLGDRPRAIAPDGAAQFSALDRMRVEGTRNLMDAAVAAGARRFIAQSYAHIYSASGEWVKSEGDPLDLGDGVSEVRRRTVEAIAALEEITLDTPGVEGVALRYGALYGPGTAYAPDGEVARLVRQRHYPIVGDGRGMTSFINVDDAAAAVMHVLEGPTGVFNICDDSPAHLSEWAPVYAKLLGAPTPRHVPALVIRTLGRQHLVYRATVQRGASNARARRWLSYQPCFNTWRIGFEHMIGAQQMAA
jgi:nucleoside-diphosphate-sugar epimerase